MNKNNFFKQLSAILIAGTIGICHIKAQTQGSGALTNTGGAGTAGTFRCFIGSGAGGANTSTGINNSFLGEYSGGANTTGDNNTFTGFESGRYSDIGGNNTFNGYQAGYNNAAHTYGGHDHVFVGYQAGYNSGNGDSEGTSVQNTFVGSGSGYSNINGGNNTLVGYRAGYSSDNGGYNTCIGSYSAYYNTSGGQNTIIGNEAGRGVVSNYYFRNSFLGYKAGYSVTTGEDDVFMGHSAGYSITTGDYNTFIGNSSGYSITTGYNNTNIGFKAGYTGTTAAHNVFLGYYSGYSNTGNGNVAIGTSALQNNTSAEQNVAVGYQALLDNTTGYYNTATGYRALENTTGESNSGFGRYALNGNTSGYNNTGSGMNALNGTTTGYNNTALGYSAGSSNTTGYNNTFVGYSANASGTNYANATAIGNSASVTASNHVVLGNSSVTSLRAAVTTITAISDGRFKENVIENVKGLEFIKKLRPVTYNLNTEALDDFIIQNLPDSVKLAHKKGLDFAPSAAIIHSGFIAQEVAQAAQESGFNSSIVYHPANETDPFGLGYAEFVVPLVKAVQELSSENDNLKAENNVQDSINASLQQQLNELKASITACCTAQNTKSLMTESLVDGSASHSKDVELSNKNIIVLDQNVPNPFADQTVINYYLPDNSNRAQILFLDQSGKLIKVVDLTEKGKGQLNVFANDLSNGIYTYSLIVDGKTMETKKMVKQ